MFRPDRGSDWQSEGAFDEEGDGGIPDDRGGLLVGAASGS
jgi:hypothetical protein